MSGGLTIEDNRLDCSRGGVIGLNLSLASGQDDARLRNVRVAGNTFNCPANVALVALRPFRDGNGAPDTRDMTIADNTFHAGSAKAIRLHGVTGLTLRANGCVKDGGLVAEPREFTEIRNRSEVLLAPDGAD